VLVHEAIELETKLYVGYCQLAAEHEPDEYIYKSLAHTIFYHLIELRSTNQYSSLSGFADRFLLGG
jgi:hypothetical protein